MSMISKINVSSRDFFKLCARQSLLHVGIEWNDNEGFIVVTKWYPRQVKLTRIVDTNDSTGLDRIYQTINEAMPLMLEVIDTSQMSEQKLEDILSEMTRDIYRQRHRQSKESYRPPTMNSSPYQPQLGAF